MFFILGAIQRDFVMNIHRSSCEVPLIIVRFWWISNFFKRIKKNPEISNILKRWSVGTTLFHAVGERERQRERLSEWDGRGARGGEVGRGFDSQCIIGIFHWHNPSGRTVAPGLTQPLIEMSTRNISWGVRGGKGGRCTWLTTLPTSSVDCL